MSVSTMLKGHDFFKALTFEEVEKVSAFSSIKSFKTGEVIYRHDAPASHMFVLLEGRVNLRLPSKESDFSLVISRVEKGELFGPAPLLGAERYTATAECAAPSTVLAVEATPLKKVLEKNALAGLGIMRAVARVYFSRYVENMNRLQNILNQMAGPA